MMLSMARSWLFLAVVAAAGCGDDDGPSSQDDGELGGHCYPNGTCNVGLTCEAGLCRAVDAGVDARFDAPLGTCNDDSALEPNESYTSAWVTPVDTTKNFPLAGLAICPATDLDYYSIAITTANENLELIIVYEAGAATLHGSLLNSAGVAIANTSMTAAQTARAYLPNLPVGTYYAMVAGPGAGQNNYMMTINVTGP